MAKPHDDCEDVRIIADSLIHFANMSADESREHFENHREDLGCSLKVPGRFGRLSISRDATRAFARLAKRQAAIDPDSHAIDLDKLDDAIRGAFVEFFIVKGRPFDEQKWVDRMLNRAVKQMKKEHAATTHYLPCVILSKGHPEEFHIGPVRFIAGEKFFADYGDKIKDDHDDGYRQQRAKLDALMAEGKYPVDQKKSDHESDELNQKVLGWITDYYGSFTWIAELTVPPCSSKVSRARAETTVQAALDVLKLFFGYRGGRDYRLGHHRGERDRIAHLTRGLDGVFHYSIRSGGEGGSAEEGWYEGIKTGPSWWALDAAGDAIHAYLAPGAVKSDHRDRWLGVLHWYGQAVTDTTPASQLVKYVAALERLTVLEETKTMDKIEGQKVTDVVTRRTALLGCESDDAADIARTRTEARTLYDWRSALMHGRSSPLTKELDDVMHLAHRITQRAMFAALAIYVQLDMAGKVCSKDLEARFVELEVFLPDATAAEPSHA